MVEYSRRDPYLRSKYEQGVDAKIVIMGNTGTMSFHPPVVHRPHSKCAFLMFASVSAFRAQLHPGVGKTSLLHRYTPNKFEPKNTTSTTGAFFVTKKVYSDGIRVRLQLWDTAGQERFRSMVRPPHRHNTERRCTELTIAQAPMYYRGANAALILYDITNAATFEDVHGWLEGEPLVVSRSHPRFNSTVLAKFDNSELRIETKLFAGSCNLYRWLQSRPAPATTNHLRFCTAVVA